MTDVDLPWKTLTDFIIDNLEQHRCRTNDAWLSSFLLQIYDKKSQLEGNPRPSTNSNYNTHFIKRATLFSNHSLQKSLRLFSTILV